MIRKANSEDLETLVKIAREVANELHQQGIDQWSETYPDLEHFRNDLIKGGLFVYCHDLEIVGSISVLPENDPFYLELKWRFDNAYVVHRLMVKPEYRQMHIGRKLFLHAIDHAKSMRADGMKVDTHPDNY
ncbi:MAG: GNAT family N-acetyltransferase, partial [Bacilli bacterium]|nr:GNAT family N-acetyltransferase [Bacilli bacterium]